MRQGRIPAIDKSLDSDDLLHLIEQITALGLPFESVAPSVGGMHYFNFKEDITDGQWEQVRELIADYVPGTGTVVKAQRRADDEDKVAAVLHPDERLREIKADLEALDHMKTDAALVDIIRRQLIQEQAVLGANQKLWERFVR